MRQRNGLRNYGDAFRRAGGQDYAFVEGPAGLDTGDTPIRTVRLSELFTEPNRPLVIYHLMYGKRQTRPCPMCTAWIDGMNGSRSPMWLRMSTWPSWPGDPPAYERSRVLEAGTGCDSSVLVTARQVDSAAKTRGKSGLPISVFTREENGAVHHVYTAHPWMSREIQRALAGRMSPIWHILDSRARPRGLVCEARISDEVARLADSYHLLVQRAGSSPCPPQCH